MAFVEVGAEPNTFVNDAAATGSHVWFHHGFPNFPSYESTLGCPLIDLIQG